MNEDLIDGNSRLRLFCFGGVSDENYMANKGRAAVN